MVEPMKKEDFEKTEEIHSVEKEVEIKNLTERCIAAEEKNKEFELEVSELKHEIELLKKQLFGQKSEKTQVLTNDEFELQYLFNEAETESKPETEETPVVVPEHKRKAKRTKEEILKNLPFEEVFDDAEEKMQCPECGTDMVVIGKEFVRDEITYIKAYAKVTKHYVKVFKCPSCGTDESKDSEGDDIAKAVIRKGTPSKPFIPRSMCSPELMAHILFEKYVMAVPLYRQEQEFRAMGIEISRATMSNWIMYVAEQYLSPVVEEMKRQLLLGNVIHADETVVQVLREPGKKAKTESRMWVYCAAKNVGHANTLFEYQPTRNGDHAKAFLGDYSKYLVCDGYDGYNKLTSVTRCGCFAHLRRKFVDALPSDEKLLPKALSAKGVAYCNTIFNIEKELANLSPEERHKQRQQRSKPVIDDFYAWLDTIHPETGTKLSRARQYALNEKKYLYSFLGCPDVEVSNNRAENAIRPFTIGRKNWLFSTSVNGAKASALVYSIAATACANDLDIEDYFTRLFRSNEIILPWN